MASVRQHYVRNTPILVTEITDKSGAVVEITDFAPRYLQFGRVYRPMAFVRKVRPLSGTPRGRTRTARTPRLDHRHPAPSDR